MTSRRPPTRTRTRTRRAEDLEPDLDGSTVWVRTPTSLLHLLVGLAVLLAGTLVAWRFADAAAAVRADGQALTDGLPPWVRALPVIVVDAVLVLVPVVVTVALLARRRWRLWAMVSGAALAAVVASELLVGWLTREPPPDFPGAYLVDGVARTPNQPLLAGAVAALVVGLPWLRHGQRRLAAAALALHLVVTLAFGELPTVSWLVDVGMGAVCGAAVALLVGTPDRRPDRSRLAAALERSGVLVTGLEPASVDARGSTPWFATTPDGGRLFVKVLDGDNRSADLLFRLVRFVRLKRTGDLAPFSSLRRAVEHEALLSLRATSVGIATPELVAVSEVGADGMLLAYRAIDGSSLDRVDDAALTDDVLDGIWALVKELRAAGIAHRDLRLANLFLAADGTTMLIDFGFAELAAPDLLLHTDVAELLASTAPRVGVRRAVDAAERAVGTDVLAAALPRVQPLALGSATRTALQSQRLLEPLREEVRTRCGLGEVVYEEVARVRPGTVAVVAGTAMALWLVVPELAEVRGLAEAFGTADWGLVPWFLATAALAWLGGAVALRGAVTERLPLGATLQAQLATGWTVVTAPGSAGRLSLGVRFLQKQGVEQHAAGVAMGVEGLAWLLVQLALLGLSLETAARRGTISLAVPPLVVVAGLAAGAAALGAVASLVPRARRLLRETLVPALRRALGTLREVAARPRQLVQLVGGEVLQALATAVALVVAVDVFGGSTPPIVVVVVALVGSLVGGLSPTPGGIGAVEVACFVGLRTAGESAGVALAAVFLFRLATFWLPMLPGWWAARRLQRAGDI